MTPLNICLLLSLLLSSMALSVGTEELWVWENLGTPTAVTPFLSGREGIGANLQSYEGAAIAGVSTRLDLRAVEIEGHAHQITFPFEPTGSAVRTEWGTRGTALGLNLGRYFISQTGVFGRFGVGTFSFLPDQDTFLRISMISGRQSEGLLIMLDSGYLAGLSKRRSFLAVGLTSGTALTESFWLGGRLTTQTRLVDTSVGDTDPHEVSLVGIGPWVEYRNGPTQVRLTVLWHVRQNVVVDSSHGASINWSASAFPGILLTAGVPF